MITLSLLLIVYFLIILSAFVVNLVFSIKLLRASEYIGVAILILAILGIFVPISAVVALVLCTVTFWKKDKTVSIVTLIIAVSILAIALFFAVAALAAMPRVYLPGPVISGENAWGFAKPSLPADPNFGGLR